MALRQVRELDLNAPRKRKEYLTINTAEFWDRFKETYPQYSSLSLKELNKKLGDINEAFGEQIIHNRDGFEFPNRLGMMFIGTCQKTKNKNPDYTLSQKLEVEVNHKNWESDEKFCKIFYSNWDQRYHFRFHEVWGFDPCRVLKRKVSAAYPENWTKYIVVDPFKKITSLFRDRSIDLYYKNKENGNNRTSSPSDKEESESN